MISYESHSHCFIAAGTGISPFHSIVTSHKHLKYEIIHGVRFDSDIVKTDIDDNSYTACISGKNSINGTKKHFSGRVNHYLKNNFKAADFYYLCGNSNMIYAIFDILQEQGISREKVRTEVYF